jgi:biopolymer transport protein ExbB/TolQ
MNLAEIGVLFAKGVLILFSVVSIGVMIERLINLRRMRQIEESEYSALRDMLRQGQVDSAAACIAASQAPSVAALQAGLDLKDAHPDLVHEAITQEIEVQSAFLHRNLPMLATVASTAPYVGLFGTVLGILLAFGKIAETGQTGASVVAAPIAEALTATALGLGVAIPAVMAYNYFSGRVNDLSLRVETHALELAARWASLKTAEGQLLGGDSHAR